MVEQPSDQPDQQQNAGGFGTAIRRVMIIGAPGSGKSTAARMIGEKLGLPVFYMDREVHWLPNWEERAKAEKMIAVDRIIAQKAWVFEGGHSSSYEKRAARADLLIWLDIPLWLRVIRVVRRSIRQRGQSRPDLADDCPEKLRMLPEFLHYILTTNGSHKRRKHAFFDSAALPKHRFKRTNDLNAFVKSLG